MRETKRIYLARQEGEVVAAIIPATARDGYSGDINLVVGVNADGTVAGVRVLAHKETPDGYVFDIDRNNRAHVGFGYGIHACIGQMISRLENEVLITELAKRKVDFELTGEPRHLVHNTLRGLAHLPMRFTAD